MADNTVEMAELRLRSVSPKDREFLFELYSSTRELELQQTTWDTKQKTDFCRMQFNAQDEHYRKYYPNASFDIIEKNEDRIGRLYVDRWEKEIRIVDIVIASQHRGLGIGSHFLRQLQQEAESAGKPLTIHVEKFNPALKLYERLGFKPEEDKGVYLLMKWEVS